MQIKKAPNDAILKNVLCKYEKFRIEVGYEPQGGKNVTVMQRLDWPKGAKKYSYITPSDATMLNSHMKGSKMAYEFVEVVNMAGDEPVKRGRKPKVEQE